MKIVNWNIDNNEYKRIITLHEDATKNSYIIENDDQYKIGEKTIDQTKIFELNNESFPSGVYSINNLPENGKINLNNKLEEISTYVKNNPNSSVNIQIEVGESKITNNNPSLKPGDLAALRGQNISKYLQDYFNLLVQNKELTKMPVISPFQTNVQLGTQKYNYIKGKDNPKDPKYLQDQYVKFKVSLTTEKKENIFGCLVNLTIDVSYNETPDPKFPCRGTHTCNQAVFNILLNNVIIGTANLNNDKCKPGECSRQAIYTINNDTITKIINSPNYNGKTIELGSKCVKNPCHSEALEVKITNNKNEILFHNCVSSSSKDELAYKKLLTIDTCGRPVK